jgi:phosphoglycolate phosphatase
MSKEIYPRPEVVIFDWDNTLVSSWERLHAAMSRTMSAHGVEPWGLEEAKQRMHLSSKDAFPQLFGDKWQEARVLFYDTYNQLTHMKAAPLPGALETLEQLRSMGSKIAVISNKRGDILRQEIADLNWGNFFDSIIGSCDLAEDKPHPITVWHTLEVIGTPRSAPRWFIGDTIVDMQCAKNSGCHAVLFGPLVPAAPHPGDFGIQHKHAIAHSELISLLNETK